MNDTNESLFLIEFSHVIGCTLIFGYLGATGAFWNPLDGVLWVLFGTFLGYLLAEHEKERDIHWFKKE